MALLAPVAAVAFLALALSACSGGDATPADDALGNSGAVSAGAVVVDATEAVQLLAERDELVVIDVRTPSEFADGHLVGAELIDVQDPSFRDEVDALERDAAYVLYCRTGNRSATAASIMEELGFVELYDAGGFDDLASAGADVVS